MIDPSAVFQNASTCLSVADVTQMIAGAQSATVANSGLAMGAFLVIGLVIGAAFMYLAIKAEVLHV